MKRIGRVIGLKEMYEDKYIALHADDNQEFRNHLKEANISNFSIFETRLDDERLYLFSYFEYTGDDMQCDMQKLHSKDECKKWSEITSICLEPLKGETGWHSMATVFYLE